MPYATVCLTRAVHEGAGGRRRGFRENAQRPYATVCFARACRGRHRSEGGGGGGRGFPRNAQQTTPGQPPAAQKERSGNCPMQAVCLTREAVHEGAGWWGGGGGGGGGKKKKNPPRKYVVFAKKTRRARSRPADMGNRSVLRRARRMARPMGRAVVRFCVKWWDGGRGVPPSFIARRSADTLGGSKRPAGGDVGIAILAGQRPTDIWLVRDPFMCTSMLPGAGGAGCACARAAGVASGS